MDPHITLRITVRMSTECHTETSISCLKDATAVTTILSLSCLKKIMHPLLRTLTKIK